MNCWKIIQFEIQNTINSGLLEWLEETLRIISIHCFEWTVMKKSKEYLKYPLPILLFVWMLKMGYSNPFMQIPQDVSPQYHIFHFLEYFPFILGFMPGFKDNVQTKGLCTIRSTFFCSPWDHRSNSGGNENLIRGCSIYNIWTFLVSLAGVLVISRTDSRNTHFPSLEKSAIHYKFN